MFKLAVDAVCGQDFPALSVWQIPALYYLTSYNLIRSTPSDEFTNIELYILISIKVYWRNNSAGFRRPPRVRSRPVGISEVRTGTQRILGNERRNRRRRAADRCHGDTHRVQAKEHACAAPIQTAPATARLTGEQHPERMQTR